MDDLIKQITERTGLPADQARAAAQTTIDFLKEKLPESMRGYVDMALNSGMIDDVANHAGGILGGISTGQPVVARFAVKPTSSILSPRRTVDRNGADTDITTKGRHDPCVGIRAVPVGEAMMACVLADHFLRHRGQVGG